MGPIGILLMNYQQLVQAFIAKGAPGANGAAPYSPAFNDAYNRYFGAVAQAHGVPNFEAIDPAWMNEPDPTATPAASSGSTALPDDQFIQSISQSGDPATNQADFDRLTKLADAGNQQAIAVLTAAGYENTPSTESLPLEQGLLQQALPGLLGDVSGDAGRRQLADTLSQQAQGDYANARNLLSPEENARRLQEELKQADVTSGRLAESAGTSTSDQLKALQNSVAAMQGNLTGDLAAKAAALQAQIAAYNANLDSYDATQKKALADQIAANQKNLEDSIGAQRQSLTTEISGLRGAADAQSVARSAALQKEIDGLTAAQVPMAQARLDSANALASSINMGLQSTEDALTATRAKQGYLGGSSFDTGNLARATIGARQGAAQALGNARELNAGDTRAIQGQGATGQRSIADELAANQAAIAQREATGGRTLADALAGGTQAIGDTGAAGNAAITAGTGATRMGIGNAGATQGYQDQVFGSSQQKSLLDALAQGSNSISATQAVQQQQARDTGTNARQGYFDNAYTRGLAGAVASPTLTSNLTNTLTGLDNYANTGLARTLGTLGWWNTNQSQPSTPGYVPVAASNSGNDLAGLGAGLVSSAFNAANANKWWQTPAQNINGIPVVNSYNNPTTAANWWQAK